MHAYALLVAFTALGTAASPQADPAACTPWQTCRQLAVDAAERGDFEAFHTIAWRAVQSGPRNDPDLMYLLARAQSLSGRPHDALVMLRRLAEHGAPRLEADTLEDFRRVRSLPEWAATLETIRNAAIAPVGPAAAAIPPVASSKAMPLPKPAGQSVREPSDPLTPLSASPAKPERLTSTAALGPIPETALVNIVEGLPLPETVRTPIAMAYDAVSGRLVIADQESDTLKIVSDLSHNAVDLVNRGWAGLYRTTAIAIDASRGDLWVVGADASTGRSDSALHRVQLISGRLRYRVSLPEDAGAAKFGALALSANRAFVLDVEGRRIFELGQGAKALRLRMIVPVTDPLSLAVSGDDVAFVSHAGGIVRLDLGRRRSAAMAASDGVDLQGLQWMEHDKGSLLGIQRRPDGSLAAVRIRLDSRGSRANSLEVVGPAASPVATVMHGIFYYLENRQGGRAVRSVSLR